jgi:gliding motility-associated-like protein
VVSGTATFADATNPTTSVSDLSIGENMLVWTIFNGPCDNAVTSDTLLIEVFDPEQTTVDAGLDQEYCVPISCATMNGSVPASPQVGTWSVISAVNGSGPVSFGSFNNVNNPQAEICGLVVGLHTLQWEIYNGPCSNDSRDTVTVSIFDNNAPAANAGPDQRLCDNGSSTNLQGNAAVFPAVGTWTVLSSPGIPQISNVNDSLALVTGLDIGITELIWTIYNGPCNELTADTVRIAVYNPATPNAAAGADQNFCEDLPDVLLSASNVLPPAIGTWTIISGGGTLVNANDPNTTLEDVPLNENILVWTVDNGACVPGITSDTLSIYVNDLSVAAANAGEDLFFCGAPDSTQLNGSVTVGLAESTWNVLSGGGDIDNSENNNPYVFNLPTGTNTFSYTVDNGECGITTDTLQITVYDPNLEPAFAGINASICASEFGQFNLQGNAVQSPAFGFWQVIDGPAEVLDSLDAETPVTTLGEILIELQGVPSTLVYTIDNGLCGITTDTVVYVLEDCLTIEIPDAFSPNADGVNDTWTIPNIASYPNNSLKIFNRWGAEVYSAAPYENEWAGISIHPATVGSELPVSTYYYILDLGEDGEVLNGFVYLKR